MNRQLVDKIVNAVLYEGYILYPYRASSKKNQRERFTFGRIYPQEYSERQNGREPCLMQTECLARNGSHDAALEITVCFLQPVARETGEQIWLEAIERELKLSPVPLDRAIAKSHPFEFGSDRVADGAVVRRNAAINGRVEVATRIVDPDTLKISVRILNETHLDEDTIDSPERVLMYTFASTHTILHAMGARFVSALDPDPNCTELAAACRNIGAWPVLVGDKERDERDVMLASPIILYDYPQIAPESAGNFFDSTEIDELLTLRVQALSDTEKIEMQRVDQQARKILERAESLRPQEFLQMHGTLRKVHKPNEEFFNPSEPRERAVVDGVTLQPGDRVRIRPKRRADVMDIALEGKIAIIEAIEEDVDKNVHFAVVLEDDPGRDIGLMRYIGHRFFYAADEVELI